VLLDTVTFLWICLAPAKLSALAIRLYEDPENDVFLSAASTYEIIVKTMIGKLDLGVAPSVFVRAEREKRGIEPLAIDEESTFAVERLPSIHADPFDRLLIAQSIAHEMTLLMPDATIARYPIRTAW
jgi:PIN domain nuclease of toxin-antitoxin system